MARKERAARAPRVGRFGLRCCLIIGCEVQFHAKLKSHWFCSVNHKVLWHYRVRRKLAVRWPAEKGPAPFEGCTIVTSGGMAGAAGPAEERRAVVAADAVLAAGERAIRRISDCGGYPGPLEGLPAEGTPG